MSRPDPNSPEARRPLMRLALWLAPAEGRTWLEDMAEEQGFVPARERLRWSLGALALALRWRFAAFSRAPRGQLAVAVTALALLLSSPWLVSEILSPPAPTLEQATAPPAPSSAAPADASADAASVEAARSEAARPEAARPETERLADPFADAARAQPAAPAEEGAAQTESAGEIAGIATDAETDIGAATAADSAGATMDAEAGVAADDEARADLAEQAAAEPAAEEALTETQPEAQAARPDTDRTGREAAGAPAVTADAPAESADASTNETFFRQRNDALAPAEATGDRPTAPQKAAAEVTLVTGDGLVLVATRPTRLAVYAGVSAEGEPALERDLEAGERLEIALPAVIVTADGGAVRVSGLGPLGADGEETTRAFAVGPTP